MSRLVIALLTVATAVACSNGDRSSTEDGGASGRDAAEPATDGGGEACDAPDRECPVSPPVSGGRCEGDLSCEYDDGTFARCMDGTWDSVGCPGCAPPLAEGCRPPYDGTLSGATVAVGPWDGGAAFRPFDDGERIGPAFGPQGGAMVEYRIRVEHDAPPACVSITSTVAIDGTVGPSATFPLRLHCGQSLRVYAILPEEPCDERDYDVTLDVAVGGAGETSARLVLEGAPCPGPAG